MFINLQKRISKKKISLIKSEINKLKPELSNLEKAIQKAVSIASKPLQIWRSADYDDKQKLQYLMFPEGLLYNKEKRVVRTPRINSLFALISSSARVLEENKKGYLVKSSLDSHFVASPRIELGSKV